MESTTQRLLIAPPAMGDANFDGTVIFVVDHDESGAVGVVVNRPTETPVEAHLPELANHVSPPDVFFRGGPVAPDHVLGLGRTGDRISLVDIEAIGAGDDASDGLRLFAGYSGWSPGQLDSEVIGGSWLVVDAFDGDVFGAKPSELWRAVLRRQGGATARLSLYPDSPSVN